MPDDFLTVDEYIASFPAEMQRMLQELRETIRATVPGLEEAISYRIPTFKLNGKFVVYIGGFRSHVGLYPVREVAPGLEDRLKPYRSGKATLRFPLGRPIPHDLVKEVVAVLAERRSNP